MLETRFPRVPGDIGNPATFDFTVMYRTVSRASPERVVRAGAEGLVEAFVEAGQDLARSGVRAIATSCGFLALHQQRLSQALPVPFASSALLQAAWVKPMLRAHSAVGIVTIDAAALSRLHLDAAGVPADSPVEGVPVDGECARVFLGDAPMLDAAKVEAEIVAAALRLRDRHPNLGAIILECTNMPPYRAKVQKATGLPVFDAVTLVNWLHAGVGGRTAISA